MSHAWGAWGAHRAEFWSDPFNWPIEARDHIFLARAVHSLGRVRHGSDWSGDEPLTQWEPPLPAYAEATRHYELDRAQRILLAHHSGYRDRVRSVALLPFPSEEEWNFAQGRSLAEHEEQWPSFERLLAVVSELCRHFEAGILPTGVRWEDGGEVIPLPRHFWNGESVGARFVACRIHRTTPFDWIPALQGGLLIFVERAPFEGFLARIRPALSSPSPPPPPSPDAEHMSIYVRFLFEQVERLKLDMQNEPKLEELIEILRAAWGTRTPELSLRILRMMATLMRSPEAQKGRGRKKPQQG